VALIRGCAGLRIATDTRATLAGVGLGAGIAVITRGAVAQILTLPGGRIAALALGADRRTGTGAAIHDCAAVVGDAGALARAGSRLWLGHTRRWRRRYLVLLLFLLPFLRFDAVLPLVVLLMALVLATVAMVAATTAGVHLNLIAREP
jgi:hypothetical protein